MTEAAEVSASGRYRFGAAVRTQAVALWQWVTRRPVMSDGVVTPLSHSRESRLLLTVLAGVEIVLAPVVDLMIPPWLRAPHLTLEAVIIVAAFSFVATWSRYPHQVRADRLLLRTGVFGELALPIEQIANVRKHERIIKGYGLRPVVDDDAAIACSVGSKVNLMLELTHPLCVELTGGSTKITRVHTAVDEPAAAGLAIWAAATDRRQAS